MTYREELEAIKDRSYDDSTEYVIAIAGLAIVEQLEKNQKPVENFPDGIPLIINSDLIKELDQDA